MSRFDTDYQLSTRKKLRVATIYLPSWYHRNDQKTIATAIGLAEEHNIGMQIWPQGGGKRDANSLLLTKYEKPIPHTREAYQELRKDVNELIQNRVPGYPNVVPVIFCQFQYRGHGIAPPESKIGDGGPPACLIAPHLQNDRVVVIHEILHCAGCSHQHGAEHKKNVMYEKDGRDSIYRFQVEALAKASFAV